MSEVRAFKLGRLLVYTGLQGQFTWGVLAPLEHNLWALLTISATRSASFLTLFPELRSIYE